MRAAATAAFALACAAACGTVLDIRPDGPADPTPDSDGGVPESSTSSDGGSADGNVQLGSLLLRVEPNPVTFIVGEMPKITVVITRKEGDLTTVMLTPQLPTGMTTITATPLTYPMAFSDTPFVLEATDESMPAKYSAEVVAESPAGRVRLQFTILLARAYRAGALTLPMTTPPMVTQVYDVEAWGGGGGTGPDGVGGAGGYARGMITVPPNTTLYVSVGSGGVVPGAGLPFGGPGGVSMLSAQNGGSGGGLSGIFFAAPGGHGHAGAALLAGGGGGGGSGPGGGGGNPAQQGGGASGGGGGGGGADLVEAGAYGGTPPAASPAAGELQGGAGEGTAMPYAGGGGGGGGYYGGGGGGANGGGVIGGGGGGGGSSFAPDGGITIGAVGTTPFDPDGGRRMDAGNPASSGAVILVPLN